MIPVGHFRHCLTGAPCTCKDGARKITEQDRMEHRIEHFARKARQSPSKGQGLRWFRSSKGKRRAS